MQREKIQEELGSRSRLFDFSVYEKHFFRHEMLASLHVSLFSWIGFYLLFLIWVLLRVATGGPISDKTTLVGPGIAMWSTAALWLVFIVIVGIQEDRLDDVLSRVVTGDETKNRLCDALDHLVSLSDNKATLDDDGTLWAEPEQPETRVGQQASGSTDAKGTKIKSVELMPILSAVAGEEGNGLDIEATGPTNVSYRAKNSWAPQTRTGDSKKQERQATLQRLRSVSEDRLRKIIPCTARMRQVVFNVLLFCYCFAAECLYF